MNGADDFFPSGTVALIKIPIEAADAIFGAGAVIRENLHHAPAVPFADGRAFAALIRFSSFAG